MAENKPASGAQPPADPAFSGNKTIGRIKTVTVQREGLDGEVDQRYDGKYDRVQHIADEWNSDQPPLEKAKRLLHAMHYTVPDAEARLKAAREAMDAANARFATLDAVAESPLAALMMLGGHVIGVEPETLDKLAQTGKVVGGVMSPIATAVGSKGQFNPVFPTPRRAPMTQQPPKAGTGGSPVAPNEPLPETRGPEPMGREPAKPEPAQQKTGSQAQPETPQQKGADKAPDKKPASPGNGTFVDKAPLPPPKVTAVATVGEHTFKGTNQEARENPEPGKRTAAADRIEDRKGFKPGNPNTNMANAHAEIEAMQKAYDAGVTKGAHMTIDLTGQNMCTFCRSNVAAMADEIGLNSLTVNGPAGEVSTWVRGSGWTQKGW